VKEARAKDDRFAPARRQERGTQDDGTGAFQVFFPMPGAPLVTGLDLTGRLVELQFTDKGDWQHVFLFKGDWKRHFTTLLFKPVDAPAFKPSRFPVEWEGTAPQPPVVGRPESEENPPFFKADQSA
jgi:hypothetical protein